MLPPVSEIVPEAQTELGTGLGETEKSVAAIASGLASGVRIREHGAKVSTETAYCLLSTTLSAERFGEVPRAHFGVENELHWVRDVTMNEDQARN